MTKDEKHKQRLVPVPLTENAVEVLQALPRDNSGAVFGHAFPTEQALAACRA
jgi:hypothetical protein